MTTEFFSKSGEGKTPTGKPEETERTFQIPGRQKKGWKINLPVRSTSRSFLICLCLVSFSIFFAGTDLKPTRVTPEVRNLDPGAPAPSLFVNALGMDFVYIQPGTFIMGSPPTETGRNDDEIPHSFILKQGFYMQTTEVTQGQWRTVMGNNPSYFDRCGDRCPVERVSLEQVSRFIRYLNQTDSLRRYRLPTEAEWEYACRAGSRHALANGKIDKTGCGLDSNLDIVGWYCGNAGGTTHTVGQKTPNAWGVFDMHGNVFEWTADWYGSYQFPTGTDPTGPFQGWVIRGGCWNSYARYCRSASRGRFPPDFRNRYLGFRLVAEPLSGE